MDDMETSTNGRILVVAVDLTAASDLALLTAVRMAVVGDELHVVHTVEVHGLREATRIEEQSQVLEHDPEVVRAYVSDTCEREEVWPLVRPEVHTRIGSPVGAVVQFCTDLEADLLICGIHEPKGLERLRASVTDSLVREAPCPVLLAKPRGYQGRRKSELPAPPCADCVATREETGDSAAWCVTHARDHQSRHSYSGAGARKSSFPSMR